MWGYIAVFYIGFVLGMFLMTILIAAKREDNDAEFTLEVLKNKKMDDQ